MQIYNTLLIILFFIGFTTFAQSQSTNKDQYIGAKIESQNPIDVSSLIEALMTKDTVNTQLKGKVNAVCQVKGCWMTIYDDTSPETEFFVKFKDYGFFMPLDLSGGEVIIQGKAYKEITSVEELKHYAEDEGLSKEEISAINEPLEELKFMADGVIIKGQ